MEVLGGVIVTRHNCAGRDRLSAVVPLVWT